MATKIKLGNRPKSFDRTVTFPMLEGGDGCMGVSMKYRTRTELALFDDELRAEIQAEADKETARVRAVLEKMRAEAEARAQAKVDDESGAIAEGAGSANQLEMTQADLVARQNAFNVRYLQRTVEGWDLDIPYDKEAIAQLVDELPAAVSAIIGDYRKAINEGRSGN
jgi:hypothetical protein